MTAAGDPQTDQKQDDHEPGDGTQAEEKLERLISGALAGLPLRHAPDALERRVLAELAQRAALPWWRRNFAQWPMAARTGFVVVCVVLAGLSLTSGLTHVASQGWAWARPVVGVMAAVGGLGSLALNLVPPFYLYLALGVGGSLYVLLFGIGAFAYRTLYLSHSNTAMVRS
jgi:hypothetical protein